MTAKTKKTLLVLAAYVAFMLLFWFVGPSEKMSKATAFFGVVSLSLVFYGVCTAVQKIIDGSRK